MLLEVKLTCSHFCVLISSLSVYMTLTVSLAKVKPLFGRHPSELRVTYFLKIGLTSGSNQV